MPYVEELGYHVSAEQLAEHERYLRERAGARQVDRRRFLGGLLGLLAAVVAGVAGWVFHQLLTGFPLLMLHGYDPSGALTTSALVCAGVAGPLALVSLWLLSRARGRGRLLLALPAVFALGVALWFAIGLSSDGAG